MSSYKKNYRSHHDNDDADKKRVYDKFSRYVRDELCDRDNPDVCVQDFDLMPKSGAYQIQCILQNVNVGKRELFDGVSRFADGAKLKIIEDVENKNGGGSFYTAIIPFKTLSKSKGSWGGGGGGGEGGEGEGGPPNTMDLIGYMSGFMGLFVFAVVKTSWVDWRFLF